MRVLIAIALFILLTSSNAFSVNPSVETGKDKKATKDRTMQQKKAVEQDRAIEVKLSLDAVFIPVLREFEKTHSIFKKCRIISQPKQPRDFGITTEAEGGLYDAVRGQLFEQQAKSSAIAPPGLHRYRNCMAFYGAVIAEAHKELAKIIPNDSVSFTDLKELAKISVEMVLYDGLKGDIKEMYDAVVNDKTPCRFNNSLHSYRCGITLLDIGRQKLTLGDVELYGNKFFGIQGEYKVSQSSKKAKEMVLAQKQQWEKTKSGKQAVSPANFLPTQ